MFMWSMIRLIVTLATYSVASQGVVQVGRTAVAVDCELLRELIPTNKVVIYVYSN